MESVKNMCTRAGATFALLAVLGACASAPILPSSMNATFTASLDADRSAYESVGRGDEYEIAVADAEKVAVAKALQSLVQTAEERSQFGFVEEQIYKEHKKYVEGSELKDRRREPDGSLKVVSLVTVNTKTLEFDLVNLGVIKEKQQIIEAVSTPSIAVLMDPSDEKEAWAPFAKNHAASYLTGRKFQVLDLDTAKSLTELDLVFNELSGGSNDSLARLALQIGSDVYLQVEANLEKGAVGSSGTMKASASVKAFETTTARQLGAATGFSKNYASGAGTRDKAIAEALSDAVNQVLVNVLDYWKTDIAQGNQFLITVRGDFADAEGQQKRRALHRALQELTKKNQQTVATDKTLNYRVWASKQATDLLFDLQDKFAAAVPGSSLKAVIENRKMLVLQMQ